MEKKINEDKEEALWIMLKDILTYYNQEEDKKKYLNAKKFYLKKTLTESDKLKEIKDYSEEQVDELLKNLPPLKAVNNNFYIFCALLGLGQCYREPDILEFFNKKDYSIYTLYKFAPIHIFQLIENYKIYIPSKYIKLLDEHFILYCNIYDYFKSFYLYEILPAKMREYIDLKKDKLILLGFTENEINEREKIIEEIKKNEGSFLTNIYNFFFPAKEFEEVKIKYS